MKFLPLGAHVMLHVRLKNVAHQGTDYRVLSQEVLEAVKSARPASIVVPTFTYSFTKSLVYSPDETPSEVGRFSEEIRQAYGAAARTKDPIFSAIDVMNFGWVQDEFTVDAFGPGSLWDRWDAVDGIVMNLDLPEIVATQIHFIEYQARVPYRFDKMFVGRVRGDGEDREIRYNYYVRDLESNPVWDRPAILESLRQAKAVHEFEWEGVPVRWFRASELRAALMPLLKANPYALLQSQRSS